ncbi:MAG: hypothetical protein MK207_08640 [Saprospiraceae bacterium]|nr:hypothetical protein [Saprospiraceae bacterium]
MSVTLSLFTLYALIVGLTATLYIKKWVELFQMRTYALYTSVPVIWSICFFIIIIFEWFLNHNWESDTNTLMFLISLLIPLIFYFIGMLIFPTPDMLDRKDKFAYLDYFDHFLNKKTSIVRLVLLAFLMKNIVLWFNHDNAPNILLGISDFLFYKNNYMVFVALLFSLFTDNKLIVFISSIIILYVWINT